MICPWRASDFRFFGFGIGGDEFRRATDFEDALSRLAVIVQFPVPRGACIRGVLDWVVEEGVGHGSRAAQGTKHPHEIRLSSSPAESAIDLKVQGDFHWHGITEPERFETGKKERSVLADPTTRNGVPCQATLRDCPSPPRRVTVPSLPWHSEARNYGIEIPGFRASEFQRCRESERATARS